MIKSNKLAIFGNSLMAEIAYYYFKNYSDYEIICFVSEEKYINKKKLFDLEVISLKKFLKKKDQKPNIFIAIGYNKLNKIREKFFKIFKKEYNYKIINFIHPNASCYQNNLGVNNFIMDNVSINPFTKIGNNNIFWSNCVIGHHTNIADNNFFSGNSTISGNCKIKNNCFFGVNSSIKDSIKIQSDCFIDANQYVSKHLKKNTYFNQKINPKFLIKSKQIFNID